VSIVALAFGELDYVDSAGALAQLTETMVDARNRFRPQGIGQRCCSQFRVRRIPTDQSNKVDSDHAAALEAAPQNEPAI
jgi:hypothetical protein